MNLRDTYIQENFFNINQQYLWYYIDCFKRVLFQGMLNKRKGKFLMLEIYFEVQLVCFIIDIIDSIYEVIMDSNKIFQILEEYYICNK